MGLAAGAQSVTTDNSFPQLACRGRSHAAARCEWLHRVTPSTCVSSPPPPPPPQVHGGSLDRADASCKDTAVEAELSVAHCVTRHCVVPLTRLRGVTARRVSRVRLDQGRSKEPGDVCSIHHGGVMKECTSHDPDHTLAYTAPGSASGSSGLGWAVRASTGTSERAAADPSGQPAEFQHR